MSLIDEFLRSLLEEVEKAKDNKHVFGTNDETRRLIKLIDSNIELKYAACIADDYNDLVNIINKSVLGHYYRQKIGIDWDDPMVIPSEVNQYLSSIKMK